MRKIRGKNGYPFKRVRTYVLTAIARLDRRVGTPELQDYKINAERSGNVNELLLRTLQLRVQDLAAARFFLFFSGSDDGYRRDKHTFSYSSYQPPLVVDYIFDYQYRCPLGPESTKTSKLFLLQDTIDNVAIELDYFSFGGDIA